MKDKILSIMFERRFAMAFMRSLIAALLIIFSFILLFRVSGEVQEEAIGLSSIQSKEKPLKIKIITYNNGVGLSQDIDILSSELKKLGHNVEFIDEYLFLPYPKADINIFLQPSCNYHESFMPYAEKNYLIPNQEWCHFSPQEIAQFDKILCKTKEAERIFKPLNPNTFFLGFTCKDCYCKEDKKNYATALHLAGASVHKGTDRVVKVWLANPQFPPLYILKHKEKIFPPPADNLRIIYDYIPLLNLRNFQNKCGLHICPSETEGFGHYIAEGMSCGAVLVTTDAPPMNEFITDPRCLVGYDRTEPFNLATRYFAHEKKLEGVIAHLLSLPVDELNAIGMENRKKYLEMDRSFKIRLKEILSSEDFHKKTDDIENAFRQIYETKEWGDNPSGDGSLPENTEVYRFFLQKFLKDHSIKEVVDLGCGNWSFSRLVDWSGINYKGYDIYKEIIEEDLKKYGSPHIQFFHGNGLQMDLPKADLLICKDVLQHLPNNQVALLLPQLSKYRHCLIINDVDPATLTSDNSDIHPGGLRCLDLTKPPFNFPGKKILTFTCGDVTKQVLYIQSFNSSG